MPPKNYENSCLLRAVYFLSGWGHRKGVSRGGLSGGSSLKSYVPIQKTFSGASCTRDEEISAEPNIIALSYFRASNSSL